MENQIKDRLTLRSNLDLGVIEAILNKHIVKCEMWSDLDLTFEEYVLLKTKIAEHLNQTYVDLSSMFRKYPITMVTDIIFFVLFEYDDINFWNGWASRFNVDADQGNIGRAILKIFERLGFKCIEDGGYKYVTPIVCQAGVPSVCFNKLFNILDSTLFTPDFEPEELIWELRGSRSYLVDVPVERYFKLYMDRAVDLVARLRSLMQYYDVSGLGLSGDLRFEGVEERIVRQFAEWKQLSRTRAYRSKSGQYFTPPKLVFDQYMGVCMLLPGQTIRSDEINKICWTIRYGESAEIQTIYLPVRISDGRNCTDDRMVPIDNAEAYEVDLFDADDLSRSLTGSNTSSGWQVAGLRDDSPVLAFSHDGVLMAQRHIAHKGTVIIINRKTARIQSTRGTQPLLSLSLPEKWDNADAYLVYPALLSAAVVVKTFAGEMVIETRQSVDFELVQNNTLFGESFTSRQIPVFTKIPDIEASLKSEDACTENLKNWQITLIHTFTNTRTSRMVIDLPLRKVGNCCRFSLTDLTSSTYGRYTVRLSDSRSTQNLTFFYVPHFDCSGFIEGIGEEKALLDSRSFFFYRASGEDATLEFEKGVKIAADYSRGVGWMKVVKPGPSAFIKGQITLSQDKSAKIPFRKTVRRMQWQFWDEAKSEMEPVGLRQFSTDEIHDTRWRLALQFTGRDEHFESCILSLEDVDGRQLQGKGLSLDMDGKCVVVLNEFEDTISAHKLPQRLMLHLSEGDREYTPICLGIIRNLVEIKNPRYQYKSRPLLYWDRGQDVSGKRLTLTPCSQPWEEKIDIPLSKVRTLTAKNGITYDGIEPCEPIRNGSYYLELTEDAEDLFFFTDVEDIPRFDRERLLQVNGKQIIEDVKANTTMQLTELLSMTAVALYRYEWLQVARETLRERVEAGPLYFDVDKCTPLLLYLIRATNDKSNLENESKALVLEICEYISVWCVSNRNRVDILRYLMESSLPDDDCLRTIEILQLILIQPNESPLEPDHMQRLWDLSEPIAILAHLRKCTQSVSRDLFRIVSAISPDALEKIVTFKREASCQSADWLDCFENMLNGNCRFCHSSFEFSTRVWGDCEEWSGLFRQNKGDFSPEEPDSSHTDGYELLNATYLRLIYDIHTCNDCNKEAEKIMLKEAHRIYNLLDKYNPTIYQQLAVLKQRAVEPAHKPFYLVGAAAILQTLERTHNVNPSDFLELRSFWKSAMQAYPKLVYRDLIMAELYAIFNTWGEC